MSTVPPESVPGGEVSSLAIPRRRDRAKEDPFIRSLLARVPFGVLATVHEGRPFVNTNLFVYDPSAHRIYIHTARTGRTPENAAAGGPATFTAAVMGRMLPAPTALEFSVEYAAAVVFGTLRAVEEEAGKREALERIMARYAPHLEPGKDYRPITAEELFRTGVHVLEIEAWSGKQKVVAPDFPGAYTFEGPLPPVPEEPASLRPLPGNSRSFIDAPLTEL